MKLFIWVALGSGLGGVLRYAVSTLFLDKTKTEFPTGTFIVNLAGCLLIGILFGLFQKSKPDLGWQLFLTTGLLGGFTTFSAFSLESIQLWQTGHFKMVITYVVLSVIGGLLLTALGFWVMKNSY